MLWPLSVELSLWRGAACLDSRSHDRALLWLTTAEFLDSDNAEVHYLLARCHRRLGRFEQVESHLGRANMLGWDRRQLEREQLLALAQTGQYGELSGQWKALFATAGSDGPEVYDAFVSACLARMRLNDASSFLAAWETDYPDDPRPHVFRGKISECLMNWSPAAESYKKALQISPALPEAAIGLARANMEVGRYEDAFSLAQTVVSIQPQSCEALLLMAQSLIKLGRLADARIKLDEQYTADPENTEVLSLLGSLELTDGNATLAISYLERGARLDPADVKLRYSFAKALRSVGRIEESEREFAFVQASTQPLIQLGRIKPRLATEPNNVDLLFEVGEITWKYRSRPDGMRWFHTVLEIAPDHRPTHEALARHYEWLGDTRQADYHLRWAGKTEHEAVRNGP